MILVPNLLLLLEEESKKNAPCSVTALTSKAIRSWDTDMDQLMQVCTNIQKYVKSIDNRLKKLEKFQYEHNNLDYDLSFLNEVLPVDSEQELKVLENLLDMKENKDAFIAFVKSIGGRNSKDYVSRILKSVYSNNFGTQCSWLGLRNNIRVSDTPVMNIIRDSLKATIAALTSKEFETYASEWFRASRMRLQREQSKTTT